MADRTTTAPDDEPELIPDMTWAVRSTSWSNIPDDPSQSVGALCMSAERTALQHRTSC